MVCFKSGPSQLPPSKTDWLATIFIAWWAIGISLFFTNIWGITGVPVFWIMSPVWGTFCLWLGLKVM